MKSTASASEPRSAVSSAGSSAVGRGALTGVLIGAGGSVAATEGEDVELPAGTVLRVRFESSVTILGGGWQAGSRNSYQTWGSYLSKRGIAVYSVDHRLSKPGQPSYPQAVHDVVAAIRFVKHNAADLNVDPDRVALMGGSAGGHLVALVGLAGDTPLF